MDKEANQKITELESTVRELRNTIARQKAIIDDYKNKEQSISSAIIASMEHANQLEASRKKLYNLDIQRSRLMYLRMEQVINDLYVKHPDLKSDNNLKDMSQKFKTILYTDLNEINNETPSFDIKTQPVVDDPIKKLLHNIIDCFDSKKTEENRGNPTSELMDNVSSSGFDFNEALHPTMELDEILKVFNLQKNDDNKK